MRQKHMKFHLAAIAAICVLIVILYMLFGPKKAGPAVEVVGDRFIQIDNATWGKNCDPFVDQALAEWRLPATGSKEAATPRPEQAQYNNVLSLISAECNGKLSCRVLATSDVMKVEPLKSCYKRLTVGYRCFTYDRLWTADIGQGDLLELDCRDKPSDNPTPPAE